eukprot:gene2754-3184_t
MAEREEKKMRSEGLRPTEPSRPVEEKGTQNPLNKLIGQAAKNNLTSLASTLRSNRKEGKTTFIHKSCRTELKNQARPTKRGSSSGAQSTSSKRVCGGSFDFKNQCFYCGAVCIFDRKHPDRNKFVEVRTISTSIHQLTLHICRTRDNDTARTVATRLLSVNDLVAAEARYHVSCRTNFEDPLPEYTAPGCPISSTKTIIFEDACKILENNME